jgi:hypothetical protein
MLSSRLLKGQEDACLGLYASYGGQQRHIAGAEASGDLDKVDLVEAC